MNVVEWHSKVWSLTLALFAVYVVAMVPQLAIAADDSNPIGDVLCAVVGWFNGPIGQGIATLAIIVVGVGALMGKVSWGMAIIVGVGVAVIFGASTIVDMLADDGGVDGGGCATT